MKGLIIKDLLLMYRNFRGQCLLFFIFGIAGAVLDITPLIILLPMEISIITLSLINLDEQSKWTRYSMMMPIDRKSIVSSKYIMLCLQCVISTFMSALLISLNMILKNDFSFEKLIVFCALCLLSTIIYPAIVLPFYLKFGAVKGRVMQLFTIGFICGTFSFVITSINDIFKYMDKISSHLAYYITISVIISAAILFISWITAIALYRKKELTA